LNTTGVDKHWDTGKKAVSYVVLAVPDMKAFSSLMASYVPLSLGWKEG
jgi:hypothetical protein